jgi:hypothetical protein
LSARRIRRSIISRQRRGDALSAESGRVDIQRRRTEATDDASTRRRDFPRVSQRGVAAIGDVGGVSDDLTVT